MSMLPRTIVGTQAPRLLRGIDAEQIYSGSWLSSTAALNTLQLGKQAVVMFEDKEIFHATQRPSAIKISQLKAVNPRIKVIGYVNTSYNYRLPSSGFFDDDVYARSAKNPDLYLSDTGWSTPLMDPLSKVWLDYQTDICSAILNLGFDGWFFDNTGHSPYHGDEITASGAATGGESDARHRFEKRAWTKPENMHAWQVFISKIHTRLYNPARRHVVACNGLGSGDRYFLSPSAGPATLLWQAGDIVCAEGFMRGATDPVIPTASRPNPWPTEARVQKEVDMLTDATRRGKVAYGLTKLWPSSAGLTQALWDQWFRLVHGVFMLGADGYHGLQFSAIAAGTVYKGSEPNTNPPQRNSTAHDRGQEWYPEYDTDWGTPIDNFTSRSSATQNNGVALARTVSGSGAYYRRRFTNGIVLVNPTASPTNVVALGGTYTRISSRSALTGGNITSIVVPAHDAVLLRKP